LGRAQQEPKFRKAFGFGFRKLAEATSLPANSLMRMFGPNGNPSAKNLFGVLAHLQARFPGTTGR
jgi:DNA-binding phage protein